MTARAALRALARIPTRVPLTPRGVLVAALAGTSLWLWGYGALDLVALTLGLGGLGVVALCALATVGLWMLLRRRLDAAPATPLPRNLEADAPLTTGFAVALPRLRALVTVRWEWTEPADVECRLATTDDAVVERIVARARTESHRLCRRFTAHDVLGLTRVSWSREETVSLCVLPAVRRLQRVEVLHSLAGGDDLAHPAGLPEGDRMEIRRYVPGDSARNVLWKVYARTRELNVRTPERSLADMRRTLVYLLSAPGDEPAAAAARVALECGACGPDWIFGADGSDEPAEDLGVALRCIARSGSPEARALPPGRGLERFLRRFADSGALRCIVFAPAVPGPWLEPALRIAAAHGGSMRFVLGTDGIQRPRRRAPLWRRALYVPEPAAGVPTGELAGLLGRIAAAGSQALVVDRASGRCFAGGDPGAARLSA